MICGPASDDFARPLAADEQPDPRLTVKRWRPSIHMPRWASRLTLEIVGVRVERLNEISEEDAIAEGIERDAAEFKNYNVKDVAFPWIGGVGAASASYSSLWESINGPGSWEANPWVWVLEFKPVESEVKA